MEKRDIQVNYDLIEVILNEMKRYVDGLENLRVATEKVNERISSGNDADSIENLEKSIKK